MNEKVYTTHEICAYLQISKGQLFKLLHSGELKCFRIGRSIRITEVALNEFIQAHISNKS